MGSKSGVLFSIRFYQFFFSPILYGLGVRCRFFPSCSEYAIQVFEKKSFSSALLLTLKRLARCSPLSSGGDDPVEKKGNA